MRDLINNVEHFESPRFDRLLKEDCNAMINYLVEELDKMKNNVNKRRLRVEYHNMLLRCLYSSGADKSILSSQLISYIKSFWGDWELIKEYKENNSVVLAESILLVFAFDVFKEVAAIRPNLNLMLKSVNLNSNDSLETEYYIVLKSGLLSLEVKDLKEGIGYYKDIFLKSVDYNSLLTPILTNDHSLLCKLIDENIESARSRALLSYERSPKKNILQKMMGYYDYGQIMILVGYLKLGGKINVDMEKLLVKYRTLF